MPTYFVDPVNGNDANDGGGWWKLALATGIGPQPVAGETATGAGGATGKVIKITGTWATTPTVYLYNRNGTAFAVGEAITFSGGGSCVNAQGTPYDSVYASFKTIHKTFAAGDIINVVKCAETGQSGTATATKGSVSVTGISGWTPAQYDIIRFDTDDTLYMIKAYSSGTITLYRPYRGTTGSGKVISKLTLHVLASNNDLLPTGGVGTATNPITLNGGIDLNTNTRLGFSIWSGNYGCFQNGVFWNISNVGFYNIGTSPSPNPTDCIYNSYFAFRWDPNNQFYTGYLRYTINGMVVEGASCSCYGIQSILNNIECGNPGGIGLVFGPLVSVTINTPKISGSPSVRIGAYSNLSVVIIDAVLDEQVAGGNNVDVYSNGNVLVQKDIVFRNPTVGAGALFALNTGSFNGQVKFQNVNGAQANYTYFGWNEFVLNAQLSYDASTYHTAAPSAKVSLYQSIYPVVIKHYIPCDAGVAKTISVYFRKNSSYGSVTLPIMRLRWMTGTAPSLVSNVQDVTMVDTNDTFLQYSYAVTPSVQGAIIMELIFQSANSGAIAWYDDIGVA